MKSFYFIVNFIFIFTFIHLSEKVIKLFQSIFCYFSIHYFLFNSI
jgi:hypothetical protein